jgi:hypothetical protein
LEGGIADRVSILVPAARVELPRVRDDPEQCPSHSSRFSVAGGHGEQNVIANLSAFFERFFGLSSAEN